jgi:ribosomal protein L29
MAESETKQNKTTKKTTAKKSVESKSVYELKADLQKLLLEVKSGKQEDTSLIKKLKKQIARNLTRENTKVK